MRDRDIPVDATNDAIMAAPREAQEMLDWAAAAFTGAQPANAPRVKVEVRRQDYNVLRFGKSCMETPITIGKQQFKHGLGTHANSEIAVTLPPGAKAFKAAVGVDNNYDTQGTRGSVQFSVEINGREVARTPTLRGGQKAAAVSVGIPAGVGQIVLKVSDAGDGPGWDQADWADARLVMADGSVVYLDENQPDRLLMSTDPPFSFVYDGAPSDQFLKSWERTVETAQVVGRGFLSPPTPARVGTRALQFIEHTVRWRDAKTGLVVTAIVKCFKFYPAADWVLYFENTGAQDTPIIENIQALDVTLRTGNSKRAAVLHHLHGDSCDEHSFVPLDTSLGPGSAFTMASTGGRPSSISAFPFFDVQYADEGIITAVGWSGQWAASLERSDRGPTRMRAGMELTRLRLHPGERIRTPRILIMPWQGDRLAAHNRWRRLLLFNYVPKQNGRPVRLPVVSQCFDRYSWSRPEWATEAGQIEAVRFAKRVGCDAHWLDAAWFEGGFPNGVGNWYCKPKEFPRGLKPIGDECHKLGLKFVVWFEPERVAAGSQIAREHPEFILGGKDGGLFRLSDPAARQWLTDLLSQRISEFGIDIYRNDFNIDPLPFWRQNDAPDRQGMTEIRYVEGHYAMWDELLAKHPGLVIDNCSGGGRRIDLETIQRSVPLWRSDTSCSPGHPDWNQAQSRGLSEYIPLYTACGWTAEPYDFRSSATGGAISQFDYLNPDFPMRLAKATMAEAKDEQKYWYGDFYPLTGCSIAPDVWMAYQFHRPDLDAGLVLAFRHGESNYPALTVSLRGLNATTKYEVELIDDARVKTVKALTGRKLMSAWELRLPKKGSSVVIRYRGRR